MIYLGNQAVGLATSIPEFANLAKIDCGNYNSNVDITTGTIELSHSLNEIPNFFMIYTKDIQESDSYTVNYVCYITIIYMGEDIGYTYSRQTTDVGSVKKKISAAFRPRNDIENIFFFNNKIILSCSNSLSFKSNTTYHYVVGKFKEVTSNA